MHMPFTTNQLYSNIMFCAQEKKKKPMLIKFVSDLNLYIYIFFSFVKLYILQVPAYTLAQVLGSTLASGALRLIFTGHENQFPGTMPAGSNLQSFALEFVITFYLMFVISGVATDNRAVSSSSFYCFNLVNNSLSQKD